MPGCLYGPYWFSMTTKKQHGLLTNMVLGPLTEVLFPHTLPRLGYTMGHRKSKSGWLWAARTFHVGLESGNDKRFRSD